MAWPLNAAARPGIGRKQVQLKTALVVKEAMSADQLTGRGLPSSDMRKCSYAVRTGYTLVSF